MAVTVFGAGAIGGITGAALTRAGHDVLLVDVAREHVDAMNAHGLTIERADGAVTVPVRAALPDAMPARLDIVLLAVKSHHTAAALETLAPRLAPEGVIVSLQNGLSEEAIAARVGAPRAMGCLVNWAADWLAPGRIQHGGEGAFVVGELDGTDSPRARQIAALLSAVTETRVTSNIWGYKWAKHVYGALLFATALVDATVYEVVARSTEVQRMLIALVCESMAVAEASGIRLEAFDEFDPTLYYTALAGDDAALAEAIELISHHYRTRTKTKTGVWRDLAVRKRKTEASFFDVTLQSGDKHGVPLPLTRAMLAMIHEVEDGRRPMAWENLDALVEVHEKTGA